MAPCSILTVGEALSLPLRYETECSVEWYYVRHCMNSPKLIHHCGLVLRGRLRASPTVSSRCCANSPDLVTCCGIVPRGRLVAAPTVAAQERYRALPRSPGLFTSPVRHWGEAPCAIFFIGDNGFDNRCSAADWGHHLLPQYKCIAVNSERRFKQ